LILGKRKKILICPLQWGLGHAGRMVPVAMKLLAAGADVFIGTSRDQINFLSKEISGARFIYFPGFSIRYSACLPQYIVILLHLPLFVYHSILEHIRLKKIIREYGIDIVISDSRLGLRSSNATSVLITHMLRLPVISGLKTSENPGSGLVRRITGKFKWCFVPDLPGEHNISGILSHGMIISKNIRYVGILSRFEDTRKNTVPVPKKYFCTVICSGPEPQKSIFKSKMEKILKSGGKPSAILEGEPGDQTFSRVTGNVTFINHLPAKEMRDLILESENLVTRSGYTTLMELISLGRSALIIPTPGQPEQEYLAGYMEKKGWFRKAEQKYLSSDTDLKEIKPGYPENILAESEMLLNEAIKDLLEDEHK